MIELIPLQSHHMRLLRPQDAQAHEVTPQQLNVPIGQSWTAIADGLPMCCGGLIPIWEGRAYAWALLDRDAGPHLMSLTRAIRSLLDQSGWRRIEMTVDASFAEGERWARLLGFRRECLAAKFLPDGRDAWVYVRF